MKLAVRKLIFVVLFSTQTPTQSLWVNLAGSIFITLANTWEWFESCMHQAVDSISVVKDKETPLPVNDFYYNFGSNIRNHRKILVTKLMETFPHLNHSQAYQVFLKLNIHLDPQRNLNRNCLWYTADTKIELELMVTMVKKETIFKQNDNNSSKETQF